MRRPLIASALLALSITAVHAEDLTSESSISVPYGDLDLSSPSDIKVLSNRLQTAAHAVCVNVYQTDIMPGALDACMKTAISGALATIGDNLERKVRLQWDARSKPILANP